MHIKPLLLQGEEVLDRVGKTNVALGCWIGVLAVGSLLGFLVSGSVLLGLAVGLFAVSFIIKPFLVAVPEVTGLLTIDLLKEGEEALTPYPTGVWFRYPWEQVKKGNYINLRQVTEEIIETYPSKDSLMKVRWLFQYTPTVLGLPRYISADDNSIKTGLRGLGSSVLSAKMAHKTGDECKKNQAEIEEALLKKFLEAKPTPLDIYGIRIDRVALADVDFDDSVQQARSSKEVSQRVQEIAKEIKANHPQISDKDALNAAMIINKNITKNVFEIEGVGPALEAIIKAFMGGKK